MSRSLLLSSLVLALLGACSKPAEAPKPKGPPPALISTTAAATATVQVVERAVGDVDSQSAPLLAAEVAGKVTRVLVDAGDAVRAGQVLAQIDAQDYALAQQNAQAEVRRLEALLANQQRQTERQRELASKQFISSSRLEDVESQLTALKEQLVGARGQLDLARRAQGKTTVMAPVAGRIDSRQVTAGDYVTPGKVLFQLATTEKLRVRLPFPEGAASRVLRGQKVRLTTPAAPGQALEGRITELRPLVGQNNRAFDALVEVNNPGAWKPGGSVEGTVIVEEHANAVVVPESSVVLRPAGLVVFVVRDGKAVQRPVKTGVTQEGRVEILQGLQSGETVAVDGAGFLTDGAAVTVKTGHKPAAGGAAK